jgi:heterodisulfide reductase subunit A
MRKQYAAVVVGAGIAGIRAALDLAVAGQRVALIDKRPTHGGILTQLDYQFPSDHCGMCRMLPLISRDSSSQFCLRKGLFHENIDLMLSTELTSLEGDPGKFHVSLKRRSSLVDPNKCISCGMCAEVCPVRVPSEFNAGLTERTAVHLPVPHAIPNHYVVDLENCIRCWKCHEICPTGAIDFKFEERGDFRILVVDKDETTKETVAEYLKDENFPIEAVGSGVEAVDLISERNVGLMLVDADIRDMDPDRLISRVREVRPGAPIVLLADEEHKEKAEALTGKDVVGVLDKPLDRKNFTPWLDKLYMRLFSDETVELEVGAVILACGFECYDPTEIADVVGYGRYPGVVTSVEFERIASGTGPSGGRIVRPGDGREVERIAWIQCVGSRDVGKNAGFCSSICCMSAIKEALLAKKRTGGRAETTVFYMDMRTFGKGYERYRDEAEEKGVDLVRARPHGVTRDDRGNLMVGWFGEDGEMREEYYDMVVLSVGARPPKDMAGLAEVADIEINEWGFCRTEEFTPARTSRLGVFAAGAFGEPKDIADSVIMAGAAAQGASRMIKIHEFLTDVKPEPEPEYPDVSRQPPKAMVAVCTSCPTLVESVDMNKVASRVERLPSVCEVVRVGGACTAEGWEEIREKAAESGANRILIGACLPYAYIPRLKELGRTIGLNPALMDVVDVYTPALDKGEKRKPEQKARHVTAKIGEGVTRLFGVDPVPPPTAVKVAKRALVVGGGLAGMTAAMNIADQGYEVCLVEETEELGGNAARLHYTLEGGDPGKFMQELIEEVEKNPKIKVYKNGRVVFSRGTAGHFRSAVSSDRGAFAMDHGVTILATGAAESKIYEYGFRVHKSVLTQIELEERLASGRIDTGELESVVMIQCWRSREEERNYCSRICCGEALKNILFLKKRNPDLPVYVFYRDIMSYGFSEKYYTEARKAGAIFIRYDLENKPGVTFDEDSRPTIEARDPVIGRTVKISPELLVLSSGIEPRDSEELQEVFGVDLDEHGFFQEAESKWRPVDFLKQGVFMCGMARGPANMSETIASAKAAASRAMRILNMQKISRETIVATVRDSLCALCLRCIDACPYGARSVDLDNETIVVDEILCQGCGSCAAVCPNSATVLTGFHDAPVMASIDAALEEIV